ncbi:MAG TPA: DUF4097 family beta strand repeat-containing protein [Gemmatimonadaceae bacterium]|nr:DUF4097 family beta strand repeat-containing protein [Gemmatimonadaceae bacterium]
MHGALTAGLVLLAALAAPMDAQQTRRQAEFESRLDTTVTFDRRGTVVLSAGGGEIVLDSWNQDRVRVRARAERGVVRLDATPARLTLELTRGRGSDVRYEVTVPVGVRVSARTTSGDITIVGTKAAVDASTQSGDLTVEDVAETIDLRTMSGDISARALAGNVEAGSYNGDVTLTDVRGDVDASSISGDITVRNAISRYVRVKSTSGDLVYDGAVDASARYELGSHAGNVHLTIPQSTGALLSVATYSGSIESDFPITLKPGEHGINRFTFEIGKGDARLSAESFSGDITVRTRPRASTDR